MQILFNTADFVLAYVLKLNVILFMSVLIMVVLLLEEAIDREVRKLKQDDHGHIHPEYSPPPTNNESIWDTMKQLPSQQLPSILLRWMHESGPIYRLNIGIRSMVIVSGDSELTRKVLTDKESTKLKPTVDIVRLFHDGGEDVFTSRGFFWKHSRKALVPAFSPKVIRSMQAVIAAEVEKFATTVLDKCVSTSNSFFSNDLQHVVASVICSASLEYHLSPDEMTTLFEDLSIGSIESWKVGIPLRWKLGWFIPEVRKAREAGRRIFNLGRKMLEAYRARECPLKGTAIDLIVNNKNYKNDKERINDIVVLMIGGFDTTTHTLSWALLLLAKHQNEQDKLRSALKRLPMDERLNSLELNCVIKESMRLQPVIALGINRTTSKDFNVKKKDGLDGDLVVPKGSKVICSLMTLFRNPYIYKNPDTFDPSRWVNPSKEALDAFIPFGCGPRSCFGRGLAKANIANVLARFVTDYKFTVDSEATPSFMISHQPNTRLFVSKA